MTLSSSNKELAKKLRRSGFSITYIEKKLGINRSTLSGWFKDIKLTESQKKKHSLAKVQALAAARIKAVAWHREQKLMRHQQARMSASWVMAKNDITPETIDIALAMLYMGEGFKNDKGGTGMANSDPLVLQFFIKAIKSNYGLEPSDFYCELHLRHDQDAGELKGYWSEVLGIPIDNFRSVSKDIRTKGRKTYDTYKGVCIVRCGNIAIQRKLKYLYTLFCEKVIGEGP